MKDIEFSKTKGVTGLVYSPYEVRPGTMCEVSMKYTKYIDYTWDIGQTFDQVIPGFVTKESIHSDKVDLSNYSELKLEDIGDGMTKVTILPPWTFSEETNLRIYYTAVVTQDILAQPAMGLIKITKTATIKDNWTVEVKHEIAKVHSVGSYTYDEPAKYSKIIQITGELGVPPDSVDVSYDYYNDYYLDFIEENGRIIPMTVIEPVFDIEGEYTLDSFSVDSQIDNNGVFYVDDVAWNVNSNGTLSIRNNILRNGKVETIVPLESDLPFLRYETLPKGQPRKKVIEIEDQRCSVDANFFGGLLVGKTIFIMTSIGLFSFDKWSNFINYTHYWSNIKGTDLSYLPNGDLIVANGDKIDQYMIECDLGYIDKIEQRIYMRKSDSDLKVNGVSVVI